MKTFKKSLYIASLTYGLIIGYVGLTQKNWIYHPYPVEQLPHPWIPIYGSSGIIAASYGPIDTHKKTAVLFHGNGSTIQDKGWYHFYVPTYNLIVFEYPGYGVRTHEALSKKNIMKESHLFMKTLKNSPDLLIGESLGTGIAMEMAYNFKIPEVILITPYDTLLSIAKETMPWLPVQWLLTENYETVRFAQKYQGKITTITAGKDSIIPNKYSHEIIRYSASHIHLQEAEHNTWMDFYKKPLK